MREPLAYPLKLLLRTNRIRVNEEELKFQLLSHPSYPSLHSLTGVLDHFAIENYALDVPPNIETLNLLPHSFLSLIKNDTYTGFVCVCKHKHGIELFFDDSKREIISTDAFLNTWTGVIAIVENKDQITPNKDRSFRYTSNILHITSILLFSFLFISHANLFQSIHFLLSIAGLAISILIKQHELGIHSRVLDKFCSEDHKKTSCNAVLNSKGAKLFGFFKFSDVGVVYFSSMLISWFLLKISTSSYNSIILITTLTIPFTLFSIFYQYQVVKKWCLLCLSVVTVLWLQAVALFLLNSSEFEFSFNTIKGELLTAFSFLGTIALYLFISPRLKKEQELDSLKIEHYKFKRNYNIFKSLISRAEIINTQINDNNEIMFGNSIGTSLLRITIITNPLCVFCKEAHELVEKLLKLKDKSIEIIIRFNVKEDPYSIDTKIALKLLEIYNKIGKQECLEAMHDIYTEFTPNDWLLKWGEPLNQELTEYLKKVKVWCIKHNINFTPEILVNGRSFPLEYSRSDLLYFIDEIIEEEAEISSI